jgi:2-dehydro-3-deoxygalactonokinase
MSAAHSLACDWGTTHLRAWVLDEAGGVVRRKKFPLGVSKLAAGEAAERFRNEVRPALDAVRLPAVLCGMIGSTLGWTVAPYVPCPADLGRIASRMVQVERDPPAWIVPGLVGRRADEAPDVMRGEETQVLGWIESDARNARGKHIICHPGTHSKWISVENGSVTRFVTAMTGELFDLLRKHSVLEAETLSDDLHSFDDGVAAAGDGNALAARIFTTRSKAVTGSPSTSASSYLSGLLIAAEIASIDSVFPFDRSRPVTLLGDRQLCRWYERVLARTSLEFSFSDGETAVLAGLSALRKRIMANDA